MKVLEQGRGFTAEEGESGGGEATEKVVPRSGQEVGGERLVGDLRLEEKACPLPLSSDLGGFPPVQSALSVFSASEVAAGGWPSLRASGLPSEGGSRWEDGVGA